MLDSLSESTFEIASLVLHLNGIGSTPKLLSKYVSAVHRDGNLSVMPKTLRLMELQTEA